MKKIILGTLCLISATKVFALSCDNPITAYDSTYCSASEMIQLDQNLNEQYKKTMSVVDKSKKSLVKNAQIK